MVMPLFRSTDIFSAERPKGWLPWGLLAPVLALAFVIASALTGDNLIARFVSMSPQGNPLDATALLAFTLVPFGLLLLVLLAWVRYVERRSWASIGIVGEDKLRDYLRGHVIGAASILGIVLVIWMAGGLQSTEIAPAVSRPAALVPIVLLLFTFALQSSTEELLFRGWLLSVLSKKFGVAPAVVVSSALFSLLHFSRGAHWLVSAGTFLFGLFACAWVLRSRNVLGIMGWHSGWNWLLAVGFGLPITGLDVGIPALLVGLQPTGPAWLTGGPQGPEASIVCLGYFLLGIAALRFQAGKSSIAS